MKRCLLCGSEFVEKFRCHQRKYCTAICAGRSRIKYQPKKPSVEYAGPYSRLGLALGCGHLTKKNRRYCVTCTTYGKRLIKNCVVCHKEMVLRVSEASKYTHCSKVCYGKTVSLRQRGQASHLWKGGLMEEQMRLRGTAVYGEWRSAVFKRDDFKCVKCGVRGGKLTADHIKPWSMFPSLRFDISNGRTMCWPCHRKYGINPGSMTKDQKQEMFLALVRSVGGIGIFATSADQVAESLR